MQRPRGLPDASPFRRRESRSSLPLNLHAMKVCPRSLSDGMHKDDGNKENGDCGAGGKQVEDQQLEDGPADRSQFHGGAPSPSSGGSKEAWRLVLQALALDYLKLGRCHKRSVDVHLVGYCCLTEVSVGS